MLHPHPHTHTPTPRHPHTHTPAHPDTHRRSATLDWSWDEADEDENAVDAPADIPYIPLIPNRRLVTGGNKITEMRRYLASRGSTRSPTNGDPQTVVSLLHFEPHREHGGDFTRRAAPALVLELSGEGSGDWTGRRGDTDSAHAGFHSCISRAAGLEGLLPKDEDIFR